MKIQIIKGKVESDQTVSKDNVSVFGVDLHPDKPMINAVARVAVSSFFMFVPFPVLCVSSIPC